MKMTRRRALRGAAGAATLRLLPGGLAAGLSFGSAGALAAPWPKLAFDATTRDEAFKQLFQSKTPEPSNAVQLTAPEIAENGSVVPVTVATSLSGVQTITLLAPGNPRVLMAQYAFGPRGNGPVSVRVRLGKSQDIVAIVATADGKLHSAAKPVKVTLGGCGG